MHIQDRSTTSIKGRARRERSAGWKTHATVNRFEGGYQVVIIEESQPIKSRNLSRLYQISGGKIGQVNATVFFVFQ